MGSDRARHHGVDRFTSSTVVAPSRDRNALRRPTPIPNMSLIRVVWGSATGPTKMASYDAALAEAGVENYNLVSVSSVIPFNVPVEAVSSFPSGELSAGLVP